MLHKMRSDMKSRWRVRDLITFLGFWQCLLIALCLLYYLHNRNLELEHQRLARKDISEFAIDVKRLHSLLNVTLKSGNSSLIKPTKNTTGEAQLIKQNLTKAEAVRIRDQKDTLPGYVPIIGNKSLRHCRKCAVVTSSGYLLETKAGPEIDNAECVIRMNDAPTVNYEADVGQRTTFRIVGHRNFPQMFDTEEERETYFVNPRTKSDAIVTAWLYSVNTRHNRENILSKKFSKKYKDVTFYMTTEDRMNRNEELFYKMLGIEKPKKALWMSTGWTTMIFALEVCDEIHVYGLTYEEYCKEHPSDRTYYHYFDKMWRACEYFNISETNIKSGHKFLTERLVFANWAFMYNITFHYPSWENHTSGKTGWESPFHEIFLKYQNEEEN